MSDNARGLLKSIGAGIGYTALIVLVFYLLMKDSYVFEELLFFIIPVSAGGGFLMGCSIWGAEIGLGRIGLILYLAAYIAPLVYGVVCAFTKDNLEYLMIPACLSVAFVLFYIQLGMGEYNLVLIIVGAVSIFAILIVLSLLTKIGPLVMPIVSGVLSGLALLVVMFFRVTKGSVLDV